MRPLSKRDRAKLMLAGSLLAPIVCVQGVRLLFDTSPATTSASTTVDVAPSTVPEMPPISMAPTHPLTPAQQKAEQWLAEYASLDAEDSLYVDLRSPMDHPPSPTPTAEPAPIEPGPTPTVETTPALTEIPPELDPREQLHVTAIMVDREHAIAFINGRLSRIGDSPMTGWTITHIDGKHRVVTLTNTQGVEIELEPATP